MKSTFHLFLLFIMFFLTIGFAFAQDQSISQEYKTEAILRLSKLMNDFYVFPDVAKQTEKHLLNQLEEGHFDQVENNEGFAKELTKSVQTINKDKHMRIRANKPYVAPVNSPERMIEERLDQITRFRNYNAGFKTVKIMDGNVGYVDLVYMTKTQIRYVYTFKEFKCANFRQVVIGLISYCLCALRCEYEG